MNVRRHTATARAAPLALAALAASCGNSVMASDMDVPGTYTGTGTEITPGGAPRMGPGTVTINIVPAGYSVDLNVPFLTSPCRLQATRTTSDAFSIATGQGCEGGYTLHDPATGTVAVNGTTVALSMHFVFNQGTQTSTFDFDGAR